MRNNQHQKLSWNENSDVFKENQRSKYVRFDVKICYSIDSKNQKAIEKLDEH